MKKIQLRIADLRKQKKLTQQELADAIGVSFQTISKWETAASMPDITLLPPLAEYFHVSTDQLLGLKPLDGESYIPEQTGTKDFWNHRLVRVFLSTLSYGMTDTPVPKCLPMRRICSLVKSCQPCTRRYLPV